MIRDIYSDKNGVLKNKLNITNNAKLKRAEAGIVFSKLIDLESVDHKTFDSNLLKNIHKHIFGDIYEWAGQYRVVPIYKEEVVIPGLSLDYSEPNKIDNDLDKAMNELNNADWDIDNIDKLSTQFSTMIAKIWKVHAFRDGNTRTTLSFSELFAKEHGFPMDLGHLLNNLVRIKDHSGRITQYSIRDKFVLASIPEEYSPEPEHLAKVFKQAIEKNRNTDRADSLENSRENFNGRDYD